MPTETRHHVSGPLELAIALAWAAGAVDAFVFQNVTPVFVANMSGNLIRFGIATGTTSTQSMMIDLLALVCFVVGTFAATVYVDHQLGRSRTMSARPVLAMEATLLVAMSLAIASAHDGYRPDPTAATFLIVALGATAMGLQAVALRRVGKVAVSTTYGTGALVRFGEKAALGMRRAERDHGVERRRTMAVIAAVLAAYVIGAAIVAALPAATWVMLIPTAVIGACAVFDASGRRPLPSA